MNKIELLKTAKDGLDIKPDIQRFAKEGWESIGEDDIERLKWYGVFLRKPTPGFFMLRVRIPNGHTHSYQVRTLAEIALKFGNGVIDLTTRQQIQIRHLQIENVPEVLELLAAAGLNSIQTGLDNVRNIMGCPVTGLSAREVLNAFPVVESLTERLLENRAFSNLPRKFNIAITGCPDNCIHSETQDLALVPARREDSDKEVYGFNVLAGGKLGSGGYRIASSLDIFLAPEEVVEVCLEIIAIFRDHGDREVRTRNRLAFLLEDWGEERFRQELSKRLQRPLTRAGMDLRHDEQSEHIGIYRQKQPAMSFVGIKVPVGRLSGEQFEHIAELAEKYGNGEIRISPSQTLILPNISDRKLGDLLEEDLLKEFDYNPHSVIKGLVSCVGNDYCSLATIETKTRAREVADKLSQKLQDTAPITMHWSGCPAGCGNHLVADIGLIGKRAKVEGKIVDAVDVFVGGRSGKHAKLAIKILEDVPCDRLPEVLEQIIPYHSRKKMHPIKNKKKQRAGKNTRKADSTQDLSQPPSSTAQAILA